MGEGNNIEFISGNAEFCKGCKNCELACARRQVEDIGLERVNELNIEVNPRIFIINNEGVKEPNYCRHCKEAACMEACPVDAFDREDGVIILDEDKCVACKLCIKACPYEVITLGEKLVGDETEMVAKKCDLCKDRQEVGKDPACFSACPTNALGLEKN
ncbi:MULTISPECIES: 4Fe-4S dicluster domain-containing protein [unclassified Candidatus Frackibacter]|uniref:4Fe-4S dicluster domain-containing protein n=1 Tax=unclassified Candidatus Frackibacter TaxID=2648818 RepID=UPI00079B91F5|nr:MULTISPECIES: 4Fe-4S dicluster domain-containing protein [unclassified Candidatus Frackibacter]KXS40730.1 MAG: 4Fe-4S ferredoxin [Candidatus Frackibacter sp. T328-2]SDC38428.1 carbon-monoxide dehydrogenase iron sulfur subunit [Candidatus Frackibacter sp. WG11]SEM61882.1 carbon-monoxide dehydrogenase iron sulfur subunit [Candidatus Frackibacter sp. WG12]SFL66104.1 carbon-monoxide dehydrogenase iron sulfur subunit [Candidatus Frackibacter sp. WG13]